MGKEGRAARNVFRFWAFGFLFFYFLFFGALRFLGVGYLGDASFERLVLGGLVPGFRVPCCVGKGKGNWKGKGRWKGEGERGKGTTHVFKILRCFFWAMVFPGRCFLGAFGFLGVGFLSAASFERLVWVVWFRSFGFRAGEGELGKGKGEEGRGKGTTHVFQILRCFFGRCYFLSAGFWALLSGRLVFLGVVFRIVLFWVFRFRVSDFGFGLG